MRVKSRSVNPTGLRPELKFGLDLCKEICSDLGYPFIITSLNDGRHSRTSLHYDGAAADFRSKHMFETDKKAALARMRAVLHKNFDLLLEYPDKDNEHFHLEWQPKRV